MKFKQPLRISVPKSDSDRALVKGLKRIGREKSLAGPALKEQVQASPKDGERRHPLPKRIHSLSQLSPEDLEDFEDLLPAEDEDKN